MTEAEADVVAEAEADVVTEAAAGVASPGHGSGRDLAPRDALVAELDVLRGLVRGEPADQVARRREVAEAARARLGGMPGSLDRLEAGFGLSSFERSVLLLAAGPELVAEVATELAEHGAGPRPTFGTALALLPEGHWSAVTPSAPLRRWELVRLLDPASPTHSPLVVDERVLHELAGAGHLDVRLAAATRPLPPAGELPAPLAAAASAVVDAWRGVRSALVSGPQPANLRIVAAGAAERLGLAPLLLPAGEIPTDALERESLLRRMERETLLAGCAWVVEEADSAAEGGGPVQHALARLDAPAVLLSASPQAPPPPEVMAVRVERLDLAHRREALEVALRQAGADPSAAHVAEVAGVFDLPLAGIRQVAADVAGGAPLWACCRERSRVSLGTLADVVTPRAGWDDLVLPPAQLEQLQALVAAVRQRSQVLDEWGFAARTTRGLGATALFAGPSGTGKTLAAEVIARELDLDLVIVDLSQVVSKYIGETEKHLRRVFDAAEDGGCVLLFDEADTLFGRRSQVRDSHDRYANLEVGYLLQRMERFRGLAILTTNARDALDPAFVRRLRTIVSFPYPDPELRQALWGHAFPPAAPVAELDGRRLAQVDVAGGGIASIALTAAYLAAEDGGIVTPETVRTAARWELAKTGRPAPIPNGRR